MTNGLSSLKGKNILRCLISWFHLNSENDRKWTLRYAKLLLKTTPHNEISHCLEIYTKPQSRNLFTAITRSFVSSPSFGDLFSILESLLRYLGLLWSSRCSIVIEGWRIWSSSFRRHLFALPARAALASSTALMTLGDLLHSAVLGRLGWSLRATGRACVQRAVKLVSVAASLTGCF